jgi:hypothetical protein
MIESKDGERGRNRTYNLVIKSHINGSAHHYHSLLLIAFNTPRFSSLAFALMLAIASGTYGE